MYFARDSHWIQVKPNKKDNLRTRDWGQHSFLPSCQVGFVSNAQHLSFQKRDEEFCCHSTAFVVIRELPREVWVWIPQAGGIGLPLVA